MPMNVTTNDESAAFMRTAFEFLGEWDAGASDAGSEAASPVADGVPAGQSAILVRNATAEPPLVGPRTTVRPSKAQLRPATLASTHHRRRREILRLRVVVSELERLLEEKRSARGTIRDGRMPSLVWRDVARRQQRLRERSELEQIKLKMQVEAHRRLAQGLLTYFNPATVAEAGGGSALLCKPRLLVRCDLQRPFPSTDEQHRIEALYTRRHDAFSPSCFHGVPTKFVDASIMENGSDEIQVDVREAWVVPFDWRRVMEAVWAFHVDEIQDYRATIVEASVQPVDVLVAQFTASAVAPSLRGECRGRMLTQRFFHDGPHGASIISTMSGKPEDTNYGSVRVVVEGWTRVLPYTVQDGVGTRLTMVQSARHIQIAFNSAAEPWSKALAYRLSKCIRDQMTADIELRKEAVERFLVETMQV